jgi:hypothetical protein
MPNAIVATLLHAVAVGRRHAGVVRPRGQPGAGQQARQVDGLPLERDVDDRRPGRP